MTNQILLIVCFAALVANSGCTNSKNNGEQQHHDGSVEMKVTPEILKQILDAFNRHDLDAIMSHFSDDCSFDFPRGPEYYGQRFVGKSQVRDALAGRFKGIPDVHYGEDRHWLSAEGDMGVSEWTLTGTTVSGIRLKVRGCDLWTFRNGKVIRKDSYWKIVEPAN